ncbi:capsid cement protein [Rhodococcus sp. BE178]|uniref:capsid cement protein n=1 Tax=Rhodococcus sp. BE178 TaxID=2817737 RepID=UPI003D24CA16
MAEYIPIRKPGAALVSQASASITGGQLVAVSGNGTVAPAGAASSAWLGVAAFDAVSGDKVTIHAVGEHELTASGAIAAGAVVISAAAGAVAAIGAGTDYSQVVGVAVSAAAAGKVRVVLR